MLQAAQNLLVHKSNVNLVNIRKVEITYFASFFAAFATQLAVLTGITINSSTNVFGLENSNCGDGWLYFFWVTTTLAFIYCFRALILTNTISIYGQGLALRGPLGSMTVAIDGMIAEQKNMLLAFNYAIFWSTMSVIGIFWAIIPKNYGYWTIFPAATSSTLIVVIGMGLWHNQLTRIYQRFHYVQDSTMTFDSNRSSDPRQSRLEYNVKSDIKPKSNKYQRVGKDIKEPLIRNDADSSTKKKYWSVPSLLSKALLGESDAYAPVANVELRKAERPTDCCGYITMRTGEDSVLSDPWKRFFIVIRRSNIYLYNDQFTAENHPEKAITKRPISLHSMALSATTTEPPIHLVISPIDEDDARKSYEFRCETIREANSWIEFLRAAIDQTEVDLAVHL